MLRWHNNILYQTFSSVDEMISQGMISQGMINQGMISQGMISQRSYCTIVPLQADKNAC